MLPDMTTHPMEKPTLISSLFLGVCCIACLKGTQSDSFLFALALGVLAVCCLPWLVVLRRSLWNKQYSNSGGWMTAVSILLCLSLLLGPIITAVFYLSQSIDSFGDLGSIIVLIKNIKSDK
jgi:drug/metabolite transporter (DMT)-like permease